MRITKERLGELALIFAIEKMATDGITLKPKEAKREIANLAKKMGVSPEEVAEFMLYILEHVDRRVRLEISSVLLPKSDKVEGAQSLS